jgi:excinuclease ABC subunit B
MYGGDHSRKQVLVEFGFRLPAALDNRPLKFNEFQSLVHQVIYVSATPGDFELQQCGGIITEQLIRPTGLTDPEIEVRPTLYQIDNLVEEIHRRIELNERVLVTTLTKRMAEELAAYLAKIGIKCSYIHSDVDTLQRIEIMDGLRSGKFDVLIGINLLREGLDLPEVSLVAILDADKEGFLRSERALTQTAGRAARHLNGKVIMYADTITGSMQRTLDETNRRRFKQLEYNRIHGIIPRSVVKGTGSLMGQIEKTTRGYSGPEKVDVAADPVVKYMSRDALSKAIEETKQAMKKAAAALDFIEAARLRDEMFQMEDLIKTKHE